MKMNPAALGALAKGDISNAIVASTPGGIEAQEKAGQTALVNSANMPKEMWPSREAFEQFGFVFGEDYDDLFLKATLPAGWSRAATDHSMHSDILDDQGRRRVAIFYKAAFYDRRADARLVRRFTVEKLYPKTDGAIGEDEIIPTVVMDAGVEIHRVGESKYLGDWQKGDQLADEGRAWLEQNRPGHDDIFKCWDI